MNQGEHVAVYEDPLTEETFEGTVKLLTKVEEVIVQQGKLEHWKVRFVKDGYITTRVIKVLE